MPAPFLPPTIIVKTSELADNPPSTETAATRLVVVIDPPPPRDIKKPGFRRWIVFPLAVCGIIAATLVMLALLAPPGTKDVKSEPPIPPPKEEAAPSGDTRQPPSTLKELFSTYKSYVIVIRIPDGQGTGVMLWSDGQGILAATARHVVEPFSQATPPPLGRIVLVEPATGPASSGRIVGVHRHLDAALVWVPGLKTPAPFRQPILPSRLIEVTESVWLIGHPLGRKFSFSDGRITRAPDGGLMQFNASISSGNSGAPLYDLHGNLLGIVSAASGSDVQGLITQNLNFAVRADAYLDSRDWVLTPDGMAKLSAFIRDSQSGHRLP